MEIIKNCNVVKAGGTSYKTAMRFRIDIPSEMRKALNLTEIDRQVKLTLVDDKIIIEKV